MTEELRMVDLRPCFGIRRGIILFNDDLDLDDLTDKNLHDHSYGITTDLLTQFTCVFSSLIHGVDHAGAPNAQLVNWVPLLQLGTMESQLLNSILLT
jgi:hypothetical protein